MILLLTPRGGFLSSLSPFCMFCIHGLYVSIKIQDSQIFLTLTQFKQPKIFSVFLKRRKQKEGLSSLVPEYFVFFNEKIELHFMFLCFFLFPSQAAVIKEDGVLL